MVLLVFVGGVYKPIKPEKFGLEVEKNVRLQKKLSMFVLQLKGQVLDFCYWPSITEGEICSSRNDVAY